MSQSLTLIARYTRESKHTIPYARPAETTSRINLKYRSVDSEQPQTSYVISKCPYLSEPSKFILSDSLIRGKAVA